MATLRETIRGETRRQRLQRALAPRSIVFVGGGWVAAGIAYCRQLGFGGRIAVVNPKRSRIEDIDCVPSIEDLPFVPDVAFVCINKHATIEAIAALDRFGVGAAVCNAAGFAEVGTTGDPLQADLRRAAGELLLLGPNSPGLVNFQTRAAVAMERFGVQPPGPGVALLTQGGALMQDWIASARSVPLTHMIGVGNQLDINVSDCIEALLDDDGVRAIALYLEALPEPAAFSRAALAALQRGVPIVALKSGRSAAGERAMFSHTASLSSPDAIADALFDRLGILRARDLPEMLETLKFLTIAPAPRGSRCAIVTASGMHSATAADAAAEVGLSIEMPGEATIDRLRDVLPGIATPGNPLDLTTIHWGDREAQAACYRALLVDGYDLALNVVNYPVPDTWDLQAWHEGFEGFADAVEAAGIVGATVSILPESFPPEAKQRHVERGIVPLQGLRESMAAIANALRWNRQRQRLLQEPEAMLRLPSVPAIAANRVHSLGEATAKRAIAELGITVPRARLLRTGSPARLDFDGPYVVKLHDPALLHKSELGALRLGLADAAAVEDAMNDIAGSVRRIVPDAVIDEFLVEQMIVDGVAEICIGVTRDERCGPVLQLAAGGTLTELLGDTVLLLLPTSRTLIEQALDSLRLAPLLRGYRGRAVADVPALVDAIFRIASFAEARRATLVELEINPMIVRPLGSGVAAVDAILRHNAPVEGGY